MTSTNNTEAVLNALRGVMDPELGDNIVDLGMVRGIEREGTLVTIQIALTVASCPLRTQIRDDVQRMVGALAGIETIDVTTSEMTPEEKIALMQRARWKAREQEVVNDIPANARIVAIASGKGGVGKSSVTANLATALALRGFTVGVLDADIWGFSLPRMLGINGEIEVINKKMMPLERTFDSGKIKLLSMGFLSQENEAIMWRGLILNRAVQHFLEDVTWGDLDYLLIDMPPGTGDIQMGLARMLPRTEMIVVTTPSLAAQQVASRAADMARKGFMRIAGVIENMSAFECDHGSTYPIFGSGGGQQLAEELAVPLLAQLPITADIAQGSDAGQPAGLDTSSTIGQAFAQLAELVATSVLPPIEMAGCSARLLDAINGATTTTTSGVLEDSPNH